MPDPAVSVILPVFNVARYVRAAVESVLSQSFSDFELLMIDDGSTDDTLRQIESIRDSRVFLERQPYRGVAAARNAALRRARGRYIAFLDGDDLWLPGKLEVDVAHLDAHPEADLIFAGLRMIDDAGHDLGRTDLAWNGPLLLSRLLLGNLIGSDTVLLRRSAREQTGWFDEELAAASDYDYWLRVALLRPNNLHGMPRLSVLYRRRAGQLTRDWPLQERCWRKIMAKMREKRPAEVAKAERPALANLYRAFAAVAYENGRRGEAIRLFSKAFRTAPWFLLRDRRTWLLGAALASHEWVAEKARKWLLNRPLEAQNGRGCRTIRHLARGHGEDQAAL